jgi:hypothetical protein
MVALTEYDELGPGIILVDTFEQKDEGGHPYGYLPQSIVEAFDNEVVMQNVREYDPQKETVFVLLKSGNQASSYRVQI